MSEETKKRIVQELPTLSNFPELPQIDNDKALMVFGSPLRKCEKEMVLAYIATIAIRQKEWKPVSVFEFRDLMIEKHMPVPHPQSIINAVWELHEAGLLEIVTLAGEEVDYLVPDLQLASMLQQSTLRVF